MLNKELNKMTREEINAATRAMMAEAVDIATNASTEVRSFNIAQIDAHIEKRMIAATEARLRSRTAILMARGFNC
jgi:hypothetical protein